MDIRIRTIEYDITPQVSTYLNERIAQIEKMLGAEGESARCEVELGKAAGHHKHTNHQWFAELQLIRPGLERLVAHNHEPNVNAAIDMAKDELLNQLRKNKTSHARSERKQAAKGKQLMREEEEE